MEPQSSLLLSQLLALLAPKLDSPELVEGVEVATLLQGPTEMPGMPQQTFVAAALPATAVLSRQGSPGMLQRYLIPFSRMD